MYTLLIADDEKLEREALKYIIRRGTANISTILEAVNGREAIEIVNNERPDIALLDIKMPGINGVDAARHIRENCPACKIVFLTAFDTFDYAREAIRLGAEDFLVKPVEDQRVLELLEKLVRRVQKERTERQIMDRTRATVNGMIKVRESELSRQLGTGLLDFEKLDDFIVLAGIESPCMELAFLKVDMQSYPMRVDLKQHAEVLLTRCEQLCRGEAEKRGMHCITGKTGSDIVMLFIGEKGAAASCAEVNTMEMEQRIREQVSLKTRLHIESGIIDFQDLERRLSVFITPEGNENIGSGLTLGENLLRLMETGNNDDLLQAEAMMLRWLYTRTDMNEALARAEEILVVLRHELYRRFPGTEFPSDTKVSLRNKNVEQREIALRQILRRLLDAVHRKGKAAGHPAVHFVAELLKKRYREELSVDIIAGLAGSSPSHLSRLFRQETGLSILDYITRLRMDEAKRLLLQKRNTPIGQIAEETGYHDPNYFSRVFRRETGLSPRAYRLSAQRKEH